jgi:hypothetical protein
MSRAVLSGGAVYILILNTMPELIDFPPWDVTPLERAVWESPFPEGYSH